MENLNPNQEPQPDPEHVEPDMPKRDGRGKILAVIAFEKDSALVYVYRHGAACTCGRVRCRHLEQSAERIRTAQERAKAESESTST